MSYRKDIDGLRALAILPVIWFHSGLPYLTGGSHGMDLYNAIAMNASNPFIVSVSRGHCRAHKFIEYKLMPPKCQYEDFKLICS